MISRRVQYETHSDDVRRMFEEHGEIKTFFDLIANRGMVFVTFVGPRRCSGAHGKNSTRFYSMIFEPLRGLGSVCKGRRLVADRYFFSLECSLPFAEFSLDRCALLPASRRQ